jgi:hypothetical protein
MDGDSRNRCAETCACQKVGLSPCQWPGHNSALMPRYAPEGNGSTHKAF